MARITKRLVDAETPGEHVRVIWDLELKGFGLKVTPVGSKIYVVQKRVQGRLRRFTIGRHGSPWTAETARSKALLILAAAVDGQDIMSGARKSSVTVAGLMDLYFAEGCRNKKPTTVKNETSFSERHIKPLLGQKKVSAIHAMDIERFMIDVAGGKTRKREKLGPRALSIVKGGKGVANRSRDLLSSALTFAVKKGYRTDNPAIGVKNYKLPPRERFLSKDEFGRLGRALKEAQSSEMNPHAIAAVRVIALSGARCGEIIGLKRDWLDFQASGARLPDSKTGARFLFLGVTAMDVIRLHLQTHESAFVFPATDGSQPFAGLKKIWRQIRKRADLEDVRLHDLRHSYASVGVSNGTSLYVVGKLLGHADADSTKRYAHLADDPLRRAADSISEDIAEMMKSD